MHTGVQTSAYRCVDLKPLHIRKLCASNSFPACIEQKSWYLHFRHTVQVRYYLLDSEEMRFREFFHGRRCLFDDRMGTNPERKKECHSGEDFRY